MNEQMLRAQKAPRQNARSEVDKALQVLFGLSASDEDVTAMPFSLNGAHCEVARDLVPSSCVDRDGKPVLSRISDEFITWPSEELLVLVQHILLVLADKQHVLRNRVTVDRHFSLPSLADGHRSTPNFATHH